MLQGQQSIDYFPCERTHWLTIQGFNYYSLYFLQVSGETSERIRAELQLLIRTLQQGYEGDSSISLLLWDWKHHNTLASDFEYSEESIAIVTRFVMNHVPPIDSNVKEAQLHTIKHDILTVFFVQISSKLATKY